jgi:hypothetical protein
MNQQWKNIKKRKANIKRNNGSMNHGNHSIDEKSTAIFSEL